MANQGDLSLPKVQKGSVGRSPSIPSRREVPFSRVRISFFSSSLSLLHCHLHPAISGDPRKGDGSILERSTRNWQPFKRCDGEREGSAAAARTIDGTLASVHLRGLSLTFEVVEDLVGLVLAGVGEGV